MYHMIHHGYCQPLHYMDMYHIWYNMFIDNLSVKSIAVYHIGYIPAVERQNHSLINIWKYVYCIIYDTKCSEGLKIQFYMRS
jgi:hypothetical protein